MEQNAKYLSIAKDINEKILIGEFKEGSIIRGRSVLASTYGVSPETIRKAISILHKEKIVEIKHGVGIFVDSCENAKRFKDKFAASMSINEKEKALKELMKEKSVVEEKITQTFDSLLATYRFQTKEAIQFHELIISESSWIVNKTIGDIYFWNYTEATIVAVIRGANVFASPGPDFKLEALDKLILVGKDELSYERALAYVLYGVMNE